MATISAVAGNKPFLHFSLPWILLFFLLLPKGFLLGFLLAKLDAQDLDAASLQYIVIRMLCYRFRIHSNSNNNNKVAVCSVHPLKLATVQCLACVKIKLAAAKSFHCSPKCFLDAWQHHHSMHTLFPANAYCENGLQEDDSSDNHGAVNLKLNTRGPRVGDSPALVFSSSCSGISTLSKPAQLSSSCDQEDGGGTWQEVGQGKSYTPTADDIGHVLKLECTVVNASNGLGVTLASTVLTSQVIPAPSPTPRRLFSLHSADGFPAAQNLEGRSVAPGTFTVLSYNVLADLYARSDIYSYCPPWALSWAYRRQNLLREVVGYQADILCLQEVLLLYSLQTFGPFISCFCLCIATVWLHSYLGTWRFLDIMRSRAHLRVDK